MTRLQHAVFIGFMAALWVLGVETVGNLGGVTGQLVSISVKLRSIDDHLAEIDRKLEKQEEEQ